MPIGGDRKRERAAAAAAATVGSTQDNGAGSSIVNQRAAAGSWAPTIPKKKQRVGDSRDKEVTVIDEDTAAHDVVEIVPSPRRGAAAPLASRAEGGCSRYGQQHEKRIADADVHAEHDAMRCLSPELLVFNDSDWLDAAVCKPWESSKVDFTAKDRRELLQLDITSHPTFHAPHSEMPRASASRRLSSLPPPSRRVTLRIDASKVRHLSTVTLVDDTKSAGGREIAALLLHLSSGLPMTEITTNPSKGLRQAVKQILITFTCSGKELEAAVSKLPQRWEALRANAGGKISPLFVKQSKANPDRAGKANASSPPAHGPQYFHYECWVEKLGCAPDVAKTADQAGEAWEAVDECQMDEGQMDDGSGLHDIDDDDSGLHNNDVPAVSQSQVAQVGTGGTSETKARLHAHAVAPVPDAKAVKTRADGTASSSSGIPSSSIGMRTTRASTASMASSGRPPPPESKKNQGSPGDVLFVFPFHQQGADTVTVTRADLDTLQDEELLNDTIMDFYIKHIESNLDQETKQQCHFFSTFFWKRLNQEKDARARHAGVAKWTRKVDIFSKRFLFVPICDSLHWTLAILCAPEGIGQLDEGGSGGGAHQSGEFARCELPDDKGGKLLHITLYLDSLGGYKKDAIEKLADYLRMEWLAKKAPGQAEASRNDDASTCYGQTACDEEEMNAPTRMGNIVARAVPVPKQINSVDCGVFVLQYIELFVKRFTVGSASSCSYAEWPDAEAKKWFPSPSPTIKAKRRDIRQLVHQLAQDYKDKGPTKPAEPETHLAAPGAPPPPPLPAPTAARAPLPRHAPGPPSKPACANGGGSGEATNPGQEEAGGAWQNETDEEQDHVPDTTDGSAASSQDKSELAQFTAEMS